MITFILASIYSDVKGGQGPCYPMSSPLCVRLRDEAEGMDDEKGGIGYIINVGVLAIYVILYREVLIDRCGRGKEGDTSLDI